MKSFNIAFACIALSLSGLLSAANADPEKLQSIDSRLQRTFDTIEHISTEEFVERRAQSRPIVVVDVRSEKEFAVGHIDGAIRINPNMSSRGVSAKLADIAEGNDVVFYCSVGVRSSRMAKRSKAALTELGARGVYNLRGGVFAWHNEARPLENNAGKTEFVHPYNRSWGRLLLNSEQTSMTPKPAMSNE